MQLLLPPHRILHLVALLIVLLTLAVGSRAQDTLPGDPGASIELRQAELLSLKGQRRVDLPHMLTNGDFVASGSRVRYRLTLELPAVPATPLGILVRKLSLAGNLRLNGQFIAGCEHGRLEDLRCLHRPYLFVPATSLWRAGLNTLEFEIHANDRQSNGLAPVVIGDSEQLFDEEYSPRYWLQVSVVEGLTWLAILLGILALAIGFILRQDSVYPWFGLTSLMYALGNLNWIVTRPGMEMEVFSWLVFSARLVSVPLLLLTMISIFERRHFWPRPLLMAYVCVSPAIIWLSGNDRQVVIALYVPMLLAGVGVLIAMLRWTFESRKPLHLAFTALLVLVFSLGLIDWLRLSGQTSFEGIYLVAYGYGLILLLMGGMLLSVLASALLQSRELSSHLEARVLERTTELEEAHRQLLVIEKEQTRIQERERLLQDMHDGLGSQLASARLMAEQGNISQEHMAQILRECIADLYLMVDTFGNSSDVLATSLIDFRFRTQRRLAGTGIALHWNMHIDEIPDQSQRVTLQILRIAQEALNNALKHARAANIWFEIEHHRSEDMLHLRIADDGIGLSEASGRGRGLDNMRQRARDIGASLTIGNGACGTEVKLSLPLR